MLDCVNDIFDLLISLLTYQIKVYEVKDLYNQLVEVSYAIIQGNITIIEVIKVL
jgi:SepF-like predicted cell division protein (DUF552 family)